MNSLSTQKSGSTHETTCMIKLNACRIEKTSCGIKLSESCSRKRTSITRLIECSTGKTRPYIDVSGSYIDGITCETEKGTR